MIGYDEFVAHAPATLARADHDQWFIDHGYDVQDLLQVARELAVSQLSTVPEGAQLTQDDLTLALISSFLFGFELSIRCERGEASA